MKMNDTQLEQVLNRLAGGESAEVVARDFPGAEAEVLSYGGIAQRFLSLRAALPKEEGLHTALTKLRAAPQQTSPIPSPFAFVHSAHTSFLYRGVFVLPLLFIVLVASGVYLWPHKNTLPTSAPEAPTGTLALEDGTAGAPAPAAFSTNDVNARTMKTSAMMAPVSPALPQDATLAGIFGSEVTHDAQAVADDSTQAQHAEDDSAAAAGYTTIYDEHAF